ncbi:cytochrome c biogenesis CcdA family protein [Corynebacterium choanae]|uniref:Cytochrome C biogenesis protein transmembrane region n=1 Tax=Corynebacterium choanae TaxID=1862358 RepID=A0A3G6JDB9_9CORY|nr:cytochrome c biogenesis CcdA family protein [Corynebacterium choanae]AZA14144.1 Cytochrome C biogenesis protein transmembrane region [Corynebacterium choanae]
MTTLGLLGAFAGGVFSLLSPCSALLLPAFFASAFSRRTHLIAAVSLFFLGLVTTLVPIGVSASFVGNLVASHRDLLITIGGVIMIGFGLLAASGGGMTIPGARALSARAQGNNPLAIYLLGCVYGFAGFCAGPLLGAVLTTATLAESTVYAGVIMAMYALGMAVPLYVLAAIWDVADIGHATWLTPKPVRFGRIHTTTTQLVAGALFIVIGVLFIVTDGLGSMPQLVDLDTQIRWQSAIGNLTAKVSDAVIVLLLALAAAGWFVFRLARPHSAAAGNAKERSAARNDAAMFSER